jgi:outer membrane receptor for ferrienterochelin and colicin
MKKIQLFIIGVVLSILIPTKAVFTQSIGGTVYELTDQKQKNFLPGVSVFWYGTTKGTVTDAKGRFDITKKGIHDQRLIFSYLGFKTDTIDVSTSKSDLEVVLYASNQKLGEVVIQSNDGGTYISKMNARKVQVITTGELYRAACCNLAESFETNASVDVSYSDAITGAKQIQLLGLSGLYGQIISENVPLVRGLGASFGLNYIPGSWMESIQVSKGTSSVVNGFESITGQINVEYKKPSHSEKLFVNLYTNSKMRYEANVNSAKVITPKLSTMILAHVDGYDQKIDHNGDNFLDIPKLHNINLFNRWDYIVPNHWVSRFGIKYMYEDRSGGTMNYNKDKFTEDTVGISAPGIPDSHYKPYGIQLNTNRVEGFWKNGLMFENKPWKSVALIVSGIYHDQNGTFGLNKYNGTEKSFNSTLLYQSIFGNENHKFTTGLNYSNNDYTENYLRTNFTYLYEINGGSTVADLFTLTNYAKKNYNENRSEMVIGGFFEYTYHIKDILCIIAGVRADQHNKWGLFYTPRINIRYQPSESIVIRGSAGKGYRTANIFAENYSFMASQRLLEFTEPLKQEEAWNYGINLTKDFKMFHNKAQFDIEFYRTDFVNQVIIDMDSMPQSVFFYNLKGQSFSNAFQVQLTVEPIKQFKLTIAYRNNDVKMEIGNRLREKPFTSKYKGLASISYATKFDKWKFDLTGQWNGPMRMPDQNKMPEKIRRNYTQTDPWFNLLGQITKKYKDWDFYLGGENLLNFTQKDTITEYFAAYHTHFDTSMVWGPLVGTTVYAGLRYNLK